MTQASRDEATSDSGGTMHRLTEPPGDGVPDLASLEPLRRVLPSGPVRAAGQAPFFAEGQVVSWFYGLWCDVLRVVRDDERGLVAWLSPGSERLAMVPSDGRAIRDRSLEERYALARCRCPRGRGRVC